LRRCFDSLLSQTFTDFELILINDGSIDKSLEILREYEAKDNRVIVVDKVNEGVSVARNTGIEIAKGEYMMFCDSDDYVEKNWVEYLLESVRLYPNALSVCDFYKVSDTGAISVNNSDIEPQSIDVYQSFKMGLFGNPVNKIYRTSIIKTNNILFSSGIPIGEDVEFNTKYFLNCSELFFIGVPLYYYCDNETSALKKYYHDLLKYHLNCFSFRYPFIKDTELSEYCDISFGYIFPMFENVFDSRNKESFFKKLRFNQQMIKTQAFGNMITHCSEKAMDCRTRKVLLKQNYYIYYLFSKLVHFKNKFFKK